MKNTTKRRILTPLNILYRFNEKLALKILYKLKTGKNLDLDKPTTFNEKIQWIKLNDKNDLMPICADKYTVRSFVEEKGLGSILNKIYWVGLDPKDIPYDKLPKKFVIKVTHGQGFNVLINNKNEINKKELEKKINLWLKEKFIPAYGEWFYGIIKPRIIIEQFLEDEDQPIPVDYKIMCFDGEPEYVFIYEDRFNNMTRTIYDKNWNYINYANFGYPSNERINKPPFIDEMLEISKVLSKDFRHARIDFYYINNKIYFGEITFTTAAGFTPMSERFALELGNLIKI